MLDGGAEGEELGIFLIEEGARGRVIVPWPSVRGLYPSTKRILEVEAST
jgi:hypothetical protein